MRFLIKGWISSSVRARFPLWFRSKILNCTGLLEGRQKQKDFHYYPSWFIHFWYIFPLSSVNRWKYFTTEIFQSKHTKRLRKAVYVDPTGGGGTPCDGLHGGSTRKDILLYMPIFIWKVGILLVELCRRVGKSVIWVLRKGPKGLTDEFYTFTNYRDNVLFLWLIPT